MRGWPVLIVAIGCAKPEPARPTPIESVSVAPQSTGSPNEPVLLVGPQKAVDVAGGDIERVKVQDEEPDASWKPPKERCPDGVTEMISVHLRLGETMELAPGGTPVSAVGRSEAVDVVYDRTRQVVRISSRKFGLVFVLTERHGQCTWYGLNSGY